MIVFNQQRNNKFIAQGAHNFSSLAVEKVAEKIMMWCDPKFKSRSRGNT
jgi:hypothetical protein